MSRPRPATAAARPSSLQSTLATAQTTGADASHAFVGTIGVSKAFPITREVYTTNMNIGLPTVKQKNMSESLRRMLDRPRTAVTSGKSKQELQQTSTSSVSFSSRPGTAASRRKTSANDSSAEINSSLITPLFSAYGVSPKDAIPSFAPTQFLQRPISAQRSIIRPPSALSMSSFTSSKRLLSASSTRPSDSPSTTAPTRGSASGVYSETRHPDHAGVGAAKLVDLTQKIVMKRMQSVLADVDAVQWQSSEDSFQVHLPAPTPANPSATGSASAAPQPWMRLHGDTEEIIVKLEWSGSAPAVSESVRNALIESLGESAAVAKLHELCGDQHSNVADIDLSVIMLDDKLSVMDVVYYNNLSSRDYSLLHSGDSKQTGSCSESAVVMLSKVAPTVHAIAFGINLHGTVPPVSQQHRAVSSEGRPSSAHVHKAEQRSDTTASLDALVASDILWVPETCRLRVLSSVHSFLLASYNISFVASDDVWNPKMTRRPMSGGGRIRMMSKSSSLDNVADSDADVQMVADSDGDAAWDELDEKNQSSGSIHNSARAGRFLGSSLRRSIHETRVSASAGPVSEQDANAITGDGSRDLVQLVQLAAGQSDSATVQYINWISFVDACDASGNLHVDRESCLAAFRNAAAALADSSTAETEGSFSTNPLPLKHFAMMMQTLLPLVRQSEAKLPTPSTLRRGMETMCSSLGYDSRQPLSERVIDISCVQRGANVFCLHRGNQSSGFAASVAAEHRSAGKHAFSVERSWYLQTLGSVSLAVNLVQNLASLRELLVMSGVFIPIIVAVEYCTAERPSVSLRGHSSDYSNRYESLKVRVERSLPFVKVAANPTWMLPGGPRISAFEVFFQDPVNMNCVCIHSKAESKCWPKASDIVAKLQRLIQSREKVYKLPVDLCPVRLTCQTSFGQMQPLPGVAVRVHRIGDESEIADICSIAGAPPTQLHTMCQWQGAGVQQFVTSDTATLCISGRAGSDGSFSTRLSAGVYVATVGGDDMVPSHALLFVRTLQKSAVTANVVVKPRLFRLSGRVINGSSGDPINHGHIAIKSNVGDGEDIVVELSRNALSAAAASSPVPQLPMTLVPVPDSFSDSCGSGAASADVCDSAGKEPSADQSGVSVPSAAENRSYSDAPHSFSALDPDEDSVSDTIFAVVNSAAEDVNQRESGGKSRSLGDKIKQMSGTFEAMLPPGDYTLSVSVSGFSAGGVYQVSMRQGALHMGIISVHPDHDLLLLNSLRDLRSKKSFRLQGVLSANMDAVSAVLTQATLGEAARKAAAAETAAAKKRVLRTKVSRISECLPASFVSSYQLSVPLILLRGSGVSTDKSGKISIRHRNHRFASLVLPPSSCKPTFDAPSIDKLLVCKNKAAHIARHILCGASFDVCEARCSIDSRSLSDSQEMHRSPFMLVVEADSSGSKNGGKFLKVGSGGRLAAIAGIPVAFTVQLSDQCMCPCLGPLDIAVNCSVRLGNSDMPVHSFPACDIGFGLYVISFVPPMGCPGTYSVSCTINSVHVEGSPFSVLVTPYEPAVTSCSRLALQPAYPCLPWPHCCPAVGAADAAPTLVVTQSTPALVASGWYAPFELYNDETARWVGSSNTVGDVDVVFVIEICLQNQQLVEALRHCTDTLLAGILQLDLCTSLNIGLVLYTFAPPSSDNFVPVQVHGPCASDDAAAMFQSALSSESFVGRALELEGNRNLLPSTPTSVDAALSSLVTFAWRPLAARTAIMFPCNTPVGLEIHHIPDPFLTPPEMRWWHSCEKLRSMSVQLHAVRLLTPYPFGPVSSAAFQQTGYPFSVSLKGRSSEAMDAKALAAIDEVTQVHLPSFISYCISPAIIRLTPALQAIKSWHIAENNPKLISAVSDLHRQLAITAHAAYAAAADACFTVQTQQTGGLFLKVSDVPSAIAAVPQLIAQSADMRLFTEALVPIPPYICESIPSPSLSSSAIIDSHFSARSTRLLLTGNSCCSSQMLLTASGFCCSCCSGTT